MFGEHFQVFNMVISECLSCLFLPSLIRDLKKRESDFPDVISGVYVYEVIPGSAASR